MNRVILIISAVLLITACGCQPEAKNSDSNLESPETSENGTLDTGEDKADPGFPPYLAGRWESDEKNRWIFVITPQGEVPKFRHFMGFDVVTAEGGLTEEWRSGGQATYILGPCYAEFDHETNQMTVKIVIEQFIIQFPNGSMEGKFEDTLKGPVSEDGMFWDVTWDNTTTLYATEDKPEEKNTETRKLKFNLAAFYD